MSNGPARFGGRNDVVLVIVLDCFDLDRSAAFWCDVLGYRAEPSSPGRYPQLLPGDGNGVELLLQRVAEGKPDEPRTGSGFPAPTVCWPVMGGVAGPDSLTVAVVNRGQ